MGILSTFNSYWTKEWRICIKDSSFLCCKIWKKIICYGLLASFLFSRNVCYVAFSRILNVKREFFLVFFLQSLSIYLLIKVLIFKSNVTFQLARRNSGGGTVYHDLGNLNCTFFTRRSAYDRRRNLEVVCAAIKAVADLDVRVNDRDDIVFNSNQVNKQSKR